jgi:phosphoglycolate phosphatase
VKGIRLVVFDLDGTLVDSAEDLAGAVNDTLATIAPGCAPLPRDVVRRFIGDGALSLMTRSLAKAGVETPPEAALKVFLGRYADRLLRTTKLYPGVEEALGAIGDRTLAVLTNKPGELSRAILEGLGVARRFARIYGGDDVSSRKPDPQGLFRLLRETQTSPKEALMVGDSAVDVRVGRAAGAGTVGVTYGFDPESLSREPPDLLLDDLRDLARHLTA